MPKDIIAAAADCDLFREIADPQRLERVARVREKIDATGVKYIYYQFVTITGRVLGKALPARHWERTASKGIQTWIGGVTDVAADLHGKLYGFSANDGELLALPDPETFVQLPWDKNVGRVFCTLFNSLEEDVDPGMYFQCDVRGNLKRFEREFRDAHDGLHLRLGLEPEMLWLRPTNDGSAFPYEGVTEARAYHIGQFESVRDLWTQVYEYGEAMGLDMVQGDVEDAPGLLELNFSFDNALRTCDRLTTYRQIADEVARQRGLIACFMAKPMVGYPALGCHHNCSLWRGDHEEIVRSVPGDLPGMEEVFTYNRGGVNEFEGQDGWMPSQLGLHALGGALKHIGALTAIGASTVNSYRRFADVGMWAPIGANWGPQNRSCTIRISSPDRFEFRAVDAMVNPYLFCGALLKAMDEGIREGIDPGPAETRNVVEVMKSGERVDLIPMNLKDALDALAADPIVLKAMPGRLHELYDLMKRDDWQRFLKEVTNWDIERYMRCLP